MEVDEFEVLQYRAKLEHFAVPFDDELEVAKGLPNDRWRVHPIDVLLLLIRERSGEIKAAVNLELLDVASQSASDLVALEKKDLGRVRSPRLILRDEKLPPDDRLSQLAPALRDEAQRNRFGGGEVGRADDEGGDFVGEERD